MSFPTDKPTAIKVLVQEKDLELLNALAKERRHHLESDYNLTRYVSEVIECHLAEERLKLQDLQQEQSEAELPGCIQ